MIDVCVVIVTLNHKKFIKSCLDSVLDNIDLPISVEIIVVDDGSTDGTRKILERYSQRLILLLREGNHSYSNNHNVAFKRVEAAKYFLILNPDTVLKKQGILGLYEFMEAHQDAGACAPKLIYPDGTLQLSCRRFPNPLTFLLRRTPFRILFPERTRGKWHLMTDWDHNQIEIVDWTLGACMILRGEALRQVGFLDERFPLYCEDIDLCHSLWGRGWSVYYNPGVVAIHDHQATSDKNLFSRHSWWHYQSMIRYILKHGMKGFKRPSFTTEKISDSSLAF